MLLNHRLQHAVGQGFFHSGEIREDNDLRHRYVYDCGAMGKYASHRDARIKSYLSREGARSTLHTLFLSHIHADHINGLEQLLDKTAGLTVDTIILPLINVADRLTAYARTTVEDPASAQNEFYRKFIVDPTAALSRFRPRQILYVEPGNRGDGAPGGGEDRPEGPDGGKFDIVGGKEGDRGPAWVLVGKGQPRWNDISVKAVLSAEPVRALVIQDTMALVTRGTQRDWLLAPFVDPTVKSHRNKFLNALAACRKLSRRKLEAWLAVTANIQKLVTTDLADLAAAYTVVSGDLNLTSMCLYSGPRTASAGPVQHEASFGHFISTTIGDNHPIAWLTTGDAALANKKRRADFIQHYRGLLDQVTTLTLPHHGSDHNFHPDLLDSIDPHFCIAAADAYSTWKHPGPRTVQGVCSRGASIHVVTSDTRSTAREYVKIFGSDECIMETRTSIVHLKNNHI
jgi:hypothetical protein